MSTSENDHNAEKSGQSSTASSKKKLNDKKIEYSQHLIVVRHGDRWDYENPDLWKNHPNNRKGDPPLSALGRQQARETGKYLESFFTKHDIASENITWMSSPFLRTLETSTEALDAMTLEDSKQIPILPEPGVFEWDGKGGEWHASLPNVKERIHYFPRLLNSATEYEPLYVPVLPEPRDLFQKRCQSLVSAMHKRHKYQPKSALVIVTHAAACIALAVAATGETKSLADITPAGPCAIYQFQRWQDSSPWYLDAHDAPDSKNGYTQHLSDLGNVTVPWNNFGDKSVHKGYTGPPTSRFAPKSLIESEKADKCDIQQEISQR